MCACMKYELITIHTPDLIRQFQDTPQSQTTQSLIFFFFWYKNLICSPQRVSWCLSIEWIITDKQFNPPLERCRNENTPLSTYMTCAGVLNKIPILVNDPEIG